MKAKLWTLRRREARAEDDVRQTEKESAAMERYLADLADKRERDWSRLRRIREEIRHLEWMKDNGENWWERHICGNLDRDSS